MVDGQLHTSFIPKKQMTRAIVSHSGFGFLTFIAVIIFSLSVAGWVGSWLYKSFLTSEVAKLKVSLQREREAFEPRLLAMFEKLDKKLTAGEELLGRHTTLVPFFETLERLTLPTIRYNTFDYQLSSQGAHQFTFSGEAVNYASIALQSDALAADPQIINPIFSDFRVTQSGTVAFALRFSINPELISYRKNIGESI